MSNKINTIHKINNKKIKKKGAIKLKKKKNIYKGEEKNNGDLTCACWDCDSCNLLFKERSTTVINKLKMRKIIKEWKRKRPLIGRSIALDRWVCCCCCCCMCSCRCRVFQHLSLSLFDADAYAAAERDQ